MPSRVSSPRRAFQLAAVFVVCVLADIVGATSVLHRSPQQLGKDASTIVLGTVRDVRSYWSPDRTKILTEALVDVSDRYKGSAPASVRVVQLGGTVGNVRVTVSGALQWRTDDEVLLFLENIRGNEYRVSGFSQGRFAVERDPNTGETYVSRAALQGIAISGGTSASASKTGTMERVKLRSFLETALPQR